MTDSQKRTRPRPPQRPADIPDNYVWCMRGQHWAHREEFSDHKRGRDGKQAHCRQHMRDANNEARERRLDHLARPRHEIKQGGDIRRGRKPITWKSLSDSRTTVTSKRPYLLPRDGMRPHDLKGLLLRRARVEAEQQGLPFALTVEDIAVPSNCVLCGAEIRRTIDQTWGNGAVLVPVDTARGFVSGNVLTVTAFAAERRAWSIVDAADAIESLEELWCNNKLERTVYHVRRDWLVRLHAWIASGSDLVQFLNPDVFRAAVERHKAAEDARRAKRFGGEQGKRGRPRAAKYIVSKRKLIA